MVASAGNNGADDARLSDPAVDPYVIAVGATDSNDRVDGWRRAGAAVAPTPRWVRLPATWIW